MEAQWKMSRGQIILSIITTVGFILLSGIVIFYQDDVPDKLEKAWYLILGAWITNWTTIINWNFGSSRSSSEKNAAIMSKLGIAVLASAIALGGCSWVDKTWNPTGKTICDQPGYESSLICEVTQKYGTTPEAANGILLDAVAIDVIVKPEHREFMCLFLKRVAEIYASPLGSNWSSFMEAFNLQIRDLNPEQQQLIWQVLQRRFPLLDLNVNVFINQYDDYLLKQAWQAHYDQLACE